MRETEGMFAIAASCISTAYREPVRVRMIALKLNSQIRDKVVFMYFVVKVFETDYARSEVFNLLDTYRILRVPLKFQ